MAKDRKAEKKSRRSGEIPVGSFSDIAFLLIIYFLVATTLIKVKSISANLPAGEKSNSAQSQKTPIVDLRGDKIRFSDSPVTLKGLEARLAALKLADQPPKQRVIMLESSDATPYKTYFQALAAISANHGVVAIVEDK